MSYKHMQVNEVLKDTADMLKRHEIAMETSSEEQQRIIDTYMRTVDGVPRVDVKTAEFCEELRKHFRGIKFGAARRGNKYAWRNGIQVVQTLWAYFPEDDYAVAQVGFADYSVGAGDDKYGVYSRTIKNHKYNSGRDQYHMSTAETLARAVKIAKQHIRRYTPNEVADMSLSDFRYGVTSGASAANSAYYDARRNLSSDINADLADEFRRILSSGYEFKYMGAKRQFEEYVTTHDAYMEAKAKPAAAVWVYVSTDTVSGQRFDVIEVPDVRMGINLPPAFGMTYDEICAKYPDVPGKIASLSMLEDNVFVEDLGRKVTERNFWVLL